ncbi:MAG: hypothetical protein HFH87_17350, partial [Lachnospiraceae bacterium]|nr:hypothetical protein [Lachnospiraceae bacterium]
MMDNSSATVLNVMMKVTVAVRSKSLFCVDSENSVFKMEETKMVESAMKKKLNIRPLVGFLQHSAFWEGPC